VRLRGCSWVFLGNSRHITQAFSLRRVAAPAVLAALTGWEYIVARAKLRLKTAHGREKEKSTMPKLHVTQLKYRDWLWKWKILANGLASSPGRGLSQVGA